MCNLLKYSDYYLLKPDSLWNFYRDKTGDVDDHVLDDKLFKYKTKIIEKIPS